MPFARPLVFFGADVFSDRQLALEMESRAGAAWALAQVRVPSPFLAARVSFKSLKDTWADTTSAHGRLMLTLVAWLSSSVS